MDPYTVVCSCAEHEFEAVHEVIRNNRPNVLSSFGFNGDMNTTCAWSLLDSRLILTVKAVEQCHFWQAKAIYILEFVDQDADIDDPQFEDFKKKVGCSKPATKKE